MLQPWAPPHGGSEGGRGCAQLTGSGASPLGSSKVVAALEKSESTNCADAIGQLPLDGGNVRSVQVWGGDAQVKLSGDTLFLTQTHAGWKVSAAACTPNADAPYDCEVGAG